MRLPSPRVRPLFPSLASSALLALSLAPAAGCQLVAGLGGEEPLATGTGGTGGTGAGASSGGSTSSSGGGGSGGCTPDEQVPCYTGPDGTQNVGVCKGGMRTCGADGAFGDCEGEVVPAAEVCGNGVDEDCNDLDCGDVIWAKQLTGALHVRVALDPKSGELYAAGSFIGKMTLGASVLESQGGRDAFLVKWSKNGDLIWAKSFGDSANQAFGPVVVDGAGDVYVGFSNVGTLAFDSVTTTSITGILKLDAAGTGQWLTPTGGQGGGVFVQAGWGNLAIATDGAVLAGGRFFGTMLIGGTAYDTDSQDGIMAKLDAASGVPAWSFQYGTDTAADGGGYIAAGPNGGVYLTGGVDGILNFMGGQIVGTMGTDGFVARFDTDGSLVWGQKFGAAAGFEQSLALTSDANGGVVTGGLFNDTFAFSGGGQTLTSNGEFDLFLGKLDQAGSHVWSGTYGDIGPAGNYGPNGLAMGPGGGLVVIGDLLGTMQFGDTTLTVDGSADGYVAKLDGASGAPVWARKIGGAAYQTLGSLSVGPDDRIAIGGEFEGAIVLGKDSFAAQSGNIDPFVAVLAP